MTTDQLRENLTAARQRIAAAAARAGRAASEIRLIGVTKYVDAALARDLFEAGLHDLGESRPQELWGKVAALQDLPVRWHLIGHLQRNKVKRTLPLVERIHSLDSLRLAEEVEREAAAATRTVDVLLEVNVSGDVAKHGLQPAEVEPLLPHLAGLSHLRVIGLMTMASLDGGLEAARRDFAALRKLRDRLMPTAPSGISLSELSMGMSGDFEVAIEEGATMVRLGSALFEGLSGS